jgi:hypothetical protein
MDAPEAGRLHDQGARHGWQGRAPAGGAKADATGWRPRIPYGEGALRIDA